jgi:hypothetical protein
LDAPAKLRPEFPPVLPRRILLALASGAALREALTAAAAPVLADWTSRAGASGGAILAAYRAG